MTSSKMTRFFNRKNLYIIFIRLICLCAITCVNSTWATTTNSTSDLFDNNNNSTNRITTKTHCQRCTNGGYSLKALTIIQEPKRPDCISGHYFAFLKNDKCECELICAKTAGQACHYNNQSNSSQSSSSSLENIHHNNSSLCDPYLNLFCNEKSKTCEGNLSLVIDHIGTDSVTVKWKNVKSPRNKNSTDLFVAKYVPQPLNPALFDKIEPSKIIESDNRNHLRARLDKLEANTTYLVKVIHNDHQELAIVTTKAKSTPKVLVTYRNATSITIVFDDFKPSSENSGYEIHYRPTSGFLHQHNQWLIIKSNGTPFYTLTGLKPNTLYKIQVFTWSEFDHIQVLSSEIIEESTLNGCVFQNRSFELNEKILDDCEQMCICVDGNVNCRKRCIFPYLSIKEAQSRNLKCIQQPNDKCCVKCSNDVPVNGSVTTNSASQLPSNFVGKPGICPTVKQLENRKDSKDVSCQNECSHDYHCTGLNKCCKNPCGNFSCVAPFNMQQSHHDCPLKCEPNAECKFIEEESAYKCICLDGFGHNNDPKINGCHPDPDRKYACFFQDRSYVVGQTFEHDCNICVCTEALEVECKHKCPHQQDNNSVVPNNCRLVEDPHDPICCKQRICDIESSAASTNHVTVHTGCHHLNESYKINETFNIGCELKCLCKTNGEVECSPRCFDDNGYNENFCHLRPDPDDPECCKISICDYNSTLIDNKILIVMAESINSTSIKFRLLLFSKINEKLTISYSKVQPNITDIDELIWKTENVTNEMITKVLKDSKEIVLTNLQPETDYSIYFKAANEPSNTVIVRTFPEGIDHTFKGCFHGSQIIQVGEIFYEGECEFKCICKEGGIRDCIERCPVYVDMITSDNCHFIPSPEDSCCTIPVCENEPIPNNSEECIFENGKHYKIGDTWNYGTGCLKKTCTCHLNPITNSSEIKCKNGCHEIPSSILKPSPSCPSPQLIQTNDPCACPYVVCANNINPLDLPDKKLQKSSKNYCEFKGNKINIGEEFYDGCQATCVCDVDASLNCRPIHCNHNFGPHTTNCLEWEIDPLFVPRPPNCCPEPKCKNDGSCSFAGIRFPNYKMIPDELLPCHKRCMCENGNVHCKNICPELSDDPPLGLPCPPSLAFRGHLPGDECCIHWQCREIYRDKIYGKCTYKDKVYKLGEYWDDTETEIHRRCQCKITNGILHVVCDPGLCQPITERFLEPTSECKSPTVVTPKDAIMCPYVICNNTATRGEEIDNIDIVAINATSLRIRFTVPSIYVGLLGHAEVHYTTDLNVPRSKWNIQKFARPKRLFDIPNIEYHLGNLHPDTTYFLQIEIIIETLKSGPISEIYKIYLPPLPMTTTSPTTSTTSTLPPVIMLDMHLTGTPLDSNTVKVSWRSFTSQEKKFIDGVQVRFKKSGQPQDVGGDEWRYSQILHRDSTFYILNKLETGTTYVVDLIFTSIEDINANIISSKPLLIDMPLPPKDDFHFDFHIYPDDVTIVEGKINIELRNLPKPVHKYVNVAKIQYQNVKTLETFYNYVNIDESCKVSITNFNSHTRYKLWIDLYMTNGQVVSSNPIDLITNFDKQFFKQGKNSMDNSNSNEQTSYVIGFTIISSVMFITGTIFLITTYICLRKHSTTASAISRACISEAAYDNPTYKTFEKNEKGGEIATTVTTTTTTTGLDSTLPSKSTVSMTSVASRNK